MDARTRRRRAALAVLDGLLDEADLVDALWFAHGALAGDAVTDIIRFVDQLAQRHGIDPASCKRLYQTLHAALRRPEAELPLDPWPLMQAARGPAAGPAAAAYGAAAWAPRMSTAPRVPQVPQVPQVPPMPAAVAGPWPVPMPSPVAAAVPIPAPIPAPMAVPMAAPAPSPAPATPPAPPPAETAPAAVPADLAATGQAAWRPDGDVPAEQAVFADLVAALAGQVAQRHPGQQADWREACRQQLLGARRIDEALRADLQAAVATLRPEATPASQQTAWRLALPATALAETLTGVYVALCEAIGPIHADQLLGQAVRQAEQQPAARAFPPRRLL